MSVRPVAGRAIVLGAGVAGLFAASVLADHVDEVVVLERDELPDVARPRNGVPQARHLHTLLPGGLETAGALLPGLEAELAAAGGVPTRFGVDLSIYRPEGLSYLAAAYRPEPLPTGISYFSMTRALFEHVVRRRVAAVANITVRDRTPACGLVLDGDRVRGVELVDGAELAAALVVDATGRTPRSLSWLTRLGWPPPVTSIVNCDVSYASAVLRPRDVTALPGSGVFVLADPASAHPTRAGYVTRIEGGCWLAGLAGRFGDYPAGRTDEWRAFGATLRWSGWDELVGPCEPAGPPAIHRFPRSVRRHLDTVDRFPEGLLLIGDALCHVNPQYGHGMSAAVLEVELLSDLLAAGLNPASDPRTLAREFFAGAADIIRTPWALASGADFLDPRTTGDFPDDAFEDLLRFVRLGTMIDDDPAAARLFVDVFTLRRPLADLGEAPWADILDAASAEAAAPTVA